jgi:hypothetical protein
MQTTNTTAITTPIIKDTLSSDVSTLLAPKIKQQKILTIEITTTTTTTTTMLTMIKFYTIPVVGTGRLFVSLLVDVESANDREADNGAPVRSFDEPDCLLVIIEGVGDTGDVSGEPTNVSQSGDTSAQLLL